VLHLDQDLLGLLLLLELLLQHSMLLSQRQVLALDLLQGAGGACGAGRSHPATRPRMRAGGHAICGSTTPAQPPDHASPAYLDLVLGGDGHCLGLRVGNNRPGC
jgi:hypothetical protein